MTSNSASVPRGIRNNNPGNILHGRDAWQGTEAKQTDGEMLQFVGPEWGLRAMIKVWLSYRARGITRLDKIVSTWCPPFHILPSGKVVKNDTAAYITNVAKRLGVPGATVVNVTERAALRLMLPAFVQQENGMQPYGAPMFERAMDLAGIAKVG